MQKVVWNSGKYWKIKTSGNSLINFVISSVIRPKGESQNGRFKKTKHTKFSEKHTFIKKSSFFRKFGVVCFRVVRNFVFRKIWCALFSWNTRFEIRPFALLPTIFNWKENITHLKISSLTQPAIFLLNKQIWDLMCSVCSFSQAVARMYSKESIRKIRKGNTRAWCLESPFNKVAGYSIQPY